MLANIRYDRNKAIEYARHWALERNPLFSDFTGRGGDCTNFVSQSILAGSCIMNFTPDFGWYFISSADRAPSWTGVEFFYDFITGNAEFRRENGGVGPYGREVTRKNVMQGDAVQLADREGDFYHSLFILSVNENEIYVAAHSDDALDRPLSSYNYASLRFIHIEGTHAEVDVGNCFDALITGTALPIPPGITEVAPYIPSEESIQGAE